MVNNKCQCNFIIDNWPSSFTGQLTYNRVYGAVWPSKIDKPKFRTRIEGICTGKCYSMYKKVRSNKILIFVVSLQVRNQAIKTTSLVITSCLNDEKATWRNYMSYKFTQQNLNVLIYRNRASCTSDTSITPQTFIVQQRNNFHTA